MLSRASLIFLVVPLVGCGPEPKDVSEPGYSAAREQPGFASVSHQVRPARVDLRQGQSLFVRNCASCHGYEGRGNGSIARNLERKPRNLARPETYLYGAGDLGVFRSTKFGVDGTPMGGWNGRMSDSEVWQVTAYVRSIQEESRPITDD